MLISNTSSNMSCKIRKMQNTTSGIAKDKQNYLSFLHWITSEHCQLFFLKGPVSFSIDFANHCCCMQIHEPVEEMNLGQSSFPVVTTLNRSCCCHHLHCRPIVLWIHYFWHLQHISFHFCSDRVSKIILLFACLWVATA